MTKSRSLIPESKNIPNLKAAANKTFSLFAHQTNYVRQRRRLSQSLAELERVERMGGGESRGVGGTQIAQQRRSIS